MKTGLGGGGVTTSVLFSAALDLTRLLPRGWRGTLGEDASQPPLPWVGPRTKSESRGSPEGCWDPGSPGGDRSECECSALCTQDQEEKALKSEGRQKTKPEDWKCSPRLWRKLTIWRLRFKPWGERTPWRSTAATPVCKECPGINCQSVKNGTSHCNPIIMVLHENKQGGQ